MPFLSSTTYRLNQILCHSWAVQPTVSIRYCAILEQYNLPSQSDTVPFLSSKIYRLNQILCHSWAVQITVSIRYCVNIGQYKLPPEAYIVPILSHLRPFHHDNSLACCPSKNGKPIFAGCFKKCKLLSVWPKTSCLISSPSLCQYKMRQPIRKLIAYYVVCRNYWQ